MFSRAVLRLSLLLILGWRAAADPVVSTIPATNAPSDAARARQRLRVAPGLQVDLWAGEPLIQNITSLSFDDLGRAYVVETGRRRTSVFDIRNFKEWVPEDLALRSVEERADYLKGMLATNAAFRAAATRNAKGGFGDFNRDGTVDSRDLEVESERIRLVWDSDRDGHADSAATFADDFRSSVSGVAAGILAQGTNVWFTCIPDLWRLPAAPASETDGRRGEIAPVNSSSRERLLHGFGVHIAYGGHDLHGLIRGPDGRIYFTIADRGATVTNREGQVISAPDAGSVFRCETDGANLELFATGLRNPQELAFDELGNLWTGDNNGDGGDQARWTLVLEGANYGWTIGWQWLPKMGAWNSERLWHTRDSNTAAYLVPPVAYVGHGPAGIAYYPGTGLGDRYQGTFFYADFPGGVRTFRVEPDGAFFRMAAGPGDSGPPTWLQDNSVTNQSGKLLWDLYPVDVTFPPDGGVVVADWVEGWEKTGKGRLWRVTDPQLASDPAIAETRRLLAEGMTQRKNAELASLLANPDFRVRLNAQWELAGRGMASWATFSSVAQGTGPRRTRLHAVWGLGQLSRKFGAKVPLASLDRLQPLLSDSDPEIRGAAARLLGGAHVSRAQEDLRSLILDPDSRVAFQGILAYRDLMGAFLGSGDLRVHHSLRKQLQEKLPDWIQSRLPQAPSEGGVIWPDHQLVERVESQGIADPVIRHATTLMVARLGLLFGSLNPQQGAFATLIKHTNAEVRLTFLLSERQLKEPGISRSLADPDPRLVLEAARAINDVPIPAALPELAALLKEENLTRLLQSAADLDHLRKTNTLVIHFTGDEWLTWTLRRSVNAAFRIGDATQATALATLATRNELPETVRIEALEDLGLWANPPSVDRVVGLHRPLPPRDPAPARSALAAAWPDLKSSRSALVLIAALDAASTLALPELPDMLTILSAHSNPDVRTAAEQRIARRQAIPVPDLMARAESGPVGDRQSALRALGASADPAASEALSRWAERLVAGQVPPALQLDVLESVSARIPDAAALRLWTNSWRREDRLAAYRVSLEGGDPVRGRRLFSERADWGCQRCHKLSGEGGEVGPELTAVGKTRGREAVLQSILYPNDAIAPGFENLIITLRDGTVVVGVLKAERPEALELLTPEEGRVVIATQDITSRERGLSAMPEGLGDMMSRSELRDLIEALSQ